MGLFAFPDTSDSGGNSIKEFSRMPQVSSRVAEVAVVQPEYLDTPAAAAFIGVSPITLEIWRSQKKGPAYTNLPRCIRYSVHDLRDWMSRFRIEAVSRERNPNERRGRPRKHPVPVEVV
jgi:hypothetical protein